MAASEASDSEEEELAGYGTALEPLPEGERIKKPVPLQEQTVKDEKGRYKRFHGAFSGGFSAGYFNTVGSKEGWAPSTFVSSRQKRADKTVLGPEDFMDEEDLSEYGIAPKEITTTDDFASKPKDRIKEKARQIAGVTASIPGATALDDLIAPAKITIGVELLRKMGWKEGQGVGPRVKRKPRKQKPDPEVKVYGCALPPEGSEGSEDEEDEYQPENVTFAPKDVMPVDLTPKENVHGLGYKGLDPTKALFGVSGGEHPSLFTDGSEKTSNLLGDLRHSKGRKLGISGQAFGVGALEEDDDDIYATETLSKYDTVLKDEEPGDMLYGWTAPKQYKNKKGMEKEVRYIGKILDGFSLASKSSAPKKTYLPPDLPRDYRPVHYFRPVITARNENPLLLQALAESTGKRETDTPQQNRHTLNASQRRELLGETALKGPSPSVLEYLSGKDKERIKEAKQAAEQQMKTQTLPQQSLNISSSSDGVNHKWQMALGEQLATPGSSDFKPFAKNPEKQKRYEDYVESLKQGQKDTPESHSDPGMTEWERGREREEFFHAAVLYKSSNSVLSSRFTRAKHEDDTDKVEVPRDQEMDIDDKESAVKMKMFGKLTRDKFEWHPEKLLCKRFNVPDPYSDSSIVGLPKVKRDKYSVFNFLTLPESTTTTITQTTNEKIQQNINPNKPKKPSRWDVSDKEKKKNDSVSEFLSLARSKVDIQQQQPESVIEEDRSRTNEPLPNKAVNESTDPKKEEESRPSMDLFKAIFASSSDEKSSSSEEDSDEETHQTPSAMPNSESTKPANLPDASSADVQECMAVTKEPDLVPPLLKEELDKKEEFGPRLPPVFFSKTTQKHEPVPLASSLEANQKEKPKKNKEKHKAKREHKHKKEKKKKHKKHRHKGKHKNKKSEKNSSSETADSSDSLSDIEEEITDLSSQELLRRLKHLPAMKQ
ncbi:G patch domain-containing protein 1 isoform X1 [Terrapene carolina triunguis]|uniref:G patch domain-containing protein 1 isoform X1 n=1 Tax=Terrapene triunguis TaxID=2587831 RepID=UPI000CEFC49C|nr:G patch domain-containing protein 1 isoform X1 [Terrapene carolina triunguis]